MKHPFEVKEFDIITCNPDYKDNRDYRYLPQDEFNQLANFIKEVSDPSSEADVESFMTLSYHKPIKDMIRVKNYVGLIQLKSGFQVQILPKIDLGEQDENNALTKRVFLKMLRCLKDFEGKVFNAASLQIERMNLYELFISMYLQEVRQLVKKGIKYAYVAQEDNLYYYKGKLLTGQHIKENIAHGERFYVSFDEFHPNRPENRLIKSTLMKLYKITSSEENSKEIRQLLIAFELVDPSVNYEKDFAKVVIDRSTRDYEMLIQWSKVILMNKSFSTFSGSTTARALLFPMESIFESFVAKNMKRVFLPKRWTVSTQDTGYHLFVEPVKRFALRPDIVVQKGDRKIIIDTKWKRLVDNESKNFGISQLDMYQMYAYSKKYGTSEIWLIYPMNNEMRNKSPITYNSGDGTVVNVFFVDVANIELSLSELFDRISSVEAV